MNQLAELGRSLWLKKHGSKEQEVITDTNGEYILEIVQGNPQEGALFGLAKLYLPKHFQNEKTR